MITENEVKALCPNSVTTNLMYGKFPYSVVFSVKSINNPCDLLHFIHARFFVHDVYCFNYVAINPALQSKCGACALRFDSIS